MSDNVAASAQNEDVFISYAREDQGTAGKVVELLKKRGRTVFWDLDIRSGEDWRERLEAKLNCVKCVLVLWSGHSVTSEFVREEARFGRSRQVLVAASLDDARLPLGYGELHTDDLAGWKGEAAPSGIFNVTRRIDELVADTPIQVDRMGKDDKLRLEQKRTKTEHISVTKHELDCEAVISQLPDQRDEVRLSIENGYSELNAAQQAARHSLNDRAPAKHYASSAQHFQEALLELPALARMRIARDGRSVGYFLSMEQATSLAFSEQTRDDLVDPQQEAIKIYTRLSHDRQYAKDAPVHFRLGCALARERTEDAIIKAIRALRKARTLASDADAKAGVTDRLLSEGRWIYAEIAKQLGVCSYFLSVLPSITPRKRKSYLDDAIQATREAVSFPIPDDDPESLIAFTVLKARGNLIFLLAQKIREGRGSAEDRDEIRKLIALLKEPASWEVAQNQVHIIDDIAFGAASIGDWRTAHEEAERNIENFAWLAVPNGLQPEEIAMEARAKEIQFFARRFLEAENAASVR